MRVRELCMLTLRAGRQRMLPEGGDRGGQHGTPLGLVPVLRPPLMDIWLFSDAQEDNMRVLLISGGFEEVPQQSWNV